MPVIFLASYPAEPASVPELRKGAARALMAHGVSRERAIDVLIALTEAVSNAVVHAFPEHEGQQRAFLRLRLVVEDDSVVIEVSDRGRGIVPWDETRGARLGLPLIAALSSELHVETAPGAGTLVRMRFG